LPIILTWSGKGIDKITYYNYNYVYTHTHTRTAAFHVMQMSRVEKMHYV